MLNNKPGVSPENRARILSIIKQHNYTPNALARSLVTQTTKTIGVVMDDLCEKFFFQLINGLQDEGEALGYNVLFCSGRGKQAIKDRYVDYFCHGRADGIIAFGSRLMDAPMVRRAAEQAPHFVLIEGNIPDLAINRVVLDNVDGAYRATKHLIDIGRQRICHFTSDMNYAVSQERLSGFLSAMGDAGREILPDSVVRADFEEATSYQQMCAMIRANAAPDGCFVGADKSAYGVLRALYEHGLRVPEDVAVIGFDDEQPDSHDVLFQQLTTMRQPLYEMGRAGISLLVRSMQNPKAPPEVVQFEPELIIRETCPKA